MAQSQSLSITACGMVTPLGFDAASSCAAIRAGIRCVDEDILWHAESGENISAGKVRLPQWWEGLGKLADLVAPAIQECLDAAAPAQPEDIPLLLAVAEKSRVHRMPGIDHRLLGEIRFRLGVEFHAETRIFADGGTGGANALRYAAQLIRKDLAPCCIVAGVDSFLQQNVFESYVDRRRILTPDNSNGFTPGEAGCAVLVGPLDKQGLHVSIMGAGFEHEEAGIESELPLRADGLTKAIAEAFSRAGVTMDDIGYRISDLNGEHYKFKEATIAMSRYPHEPRDTVFEVWHPIEYMGEIGAAIVPCALGLALDAARNGYAPGDKALCHFSGDNGQRVVFVMGTNKVA